MSRFSSGSRKESFSEYKPYGDTWEEAAIELLKRNHKNRNDRRKAEDQLAQCENELKEVKEERDKILETLKRSIEPPEGEEQTVSVTDIYEFLTGQRPGENPISFKEIQIALAGFAKEYPTPQEYEPSTHNVIIQKRVKSDIKDQPAEYFWHHGKRIATDLAEYISSYTDTQPPIPVIQGELTADKYLEVHDAITKQSEKRKIAAAFHWQNLHDKIRKCFETTLKELRQAQQARCSDPLAHVEAKNQEQIDIRQEEIKQLQEQIRIRDQEYTAKLAQEFRDKDREIANLQALRCQKPSDHTQIPLELAEKKIEAEEYRQKYENSLKQQGCPKPQEHEELEQTKALLEKTTGDLCLHILSLTNSLSTNAELAKEQIDTSQKLKETQKLERYWKKLYTDKNFELLRHELDKKKIQKIINENESLWSEISDDLCPDPTAHKTQHKWPALTKEEEREAALKQKSVRIIPCPDPEAHEKDSDEE